MGTESISQEQLRVLKLFQAEAAVNEIAKYVKSSHAYLSESTDYARGYKDGIAMAKEIIESILQTHGLPSVFLGTTNHSDVASGGF